MSALHAWALVAGLYGAPLLLVAAGRRLRRGSRRRQRMFRGAAVGHAIAVALALTASVVPPAAWGPEDLLRGALGVWSLLVLPAVGALLALTSTRDP